ncbi:MAG: nucleotidyltransferase family protein, partial [Alphaproteobacteria bacterium]|nr:nucleotidyltransferase family protein [Alphaproteobacteria bacterium]
MEILILAAGSSQRFGPTNKILQPWRNGRAQVATVIAAVVTAGLALKPARLLVVTGYQAELVQRSLAPFADRIEFCPNPQWAEGMGTSLAAGARFLAQTTLPACPLMVLLGDMPLVETACLHQLAKVAREQPGQIIQPTYRGLPGHPVIWPAELRPLLAELRGDTGGKAVFARLAQRVTRLDWPDDSVIRDIDRPEDYEA